MGSLNLPAIPEMSRYGNAGFSRDSRHTFRWRGLRDGKNGTTNTEN